MKIKTKLVFPKTFHAICEYKTIELEKKNKYNETVKCHLEVPQWEKMKDFPEHVLEYYKKNTRKIEGLEDLRKRDYDISLDIIINEFFINAHITPENLIDIKYNVVNQGEGFSQESALIIYKGAV